MTLSYRIQGGDFDSAGLATRKLKEHMARIGVAGPVLRRAMIASYEAEMNVVIHARTGTLWARLDDATLDLEIADEGPGIPDVTLALREGWSTASSRAREMGFGAGMGLPNIRRNSDRFEIETRVGRGTRIHSTIRLRPADDEPAPAQCAGACPVVAVDRCRRCLRCIFSCPSGALRVGSGGPIIRAAVCVGCTACAAECDAGVFSLPTTPIDRKALRDAVLVAPRGFAAGLAAAGSVQRVFDALRDLGFGAVRFAEEWETALIAAARGRVVGGAPGPCIPPVCSAVVDLVESRFPSLIPQLGSWLTPLEAAGEEFPLQPVALLASCPSQYGALKRASLTDRLSVLTPASLVEALRPILNGAAAGPGAAFRAGGEPEQVPGELTVTGVRHVLRALAAAEAGALPDVSLLRLSLCEGGCSGSPLVCSDAQIAARLWPALSPRDAGGEAAAVARSRPYTQRPGMRLDPDMAEAIRKLSAIDALTKTLPGRDCGACGAPGCAAFAEDVVTGGSRAGDCPYAAEEASP